MASWKVYTYLCTDCSAQWDAKVEFEKRDEQQQCGVCESTKTKRIPSAPRVLRESRLDGTYDKTDGHVRYKEALRLKSLAANHKHGSEERLRMEQQAKRLQNSTLKNDEV